jgi:hypothetical protein
MMSVIVVGLTENADAMSLDMSPRLFIALISETSAAVKREFPFAAPFSIGMNMRPLATASDRFSD